MCELSGLHVNGYISSAGFLYVRKEACPGDAMTSLPTTFGILSLLLAAAPGLNAATNSLPHALTAQAPTANYNWPKTYTNPLSLETSNGPAVRCPDPAIISQTTDGRSTWYLYCTGDPLNSSDVNAQGQLNAHLITQYQSYDLIHWTYIGD